MRLNLVGGIVAALLIVALIIAYSTLFTVYQTRQALVVRLGQPVRVVTEPGLNYKIPLVDNVIHIDNRILDLENPAQEVIASDQKRLVVDAFARYRIKEPLKFYQTVGTVERANQQLSILLNSALRRVLGEATLTQVVRDQREQLMARVREQLDNEAQAFGISVVDVRIRRADLPEQNSQAVYQRMQTERQQEAAQFRAQGSQRSQEIRARADRDVTVLLADAQSKGEQTRGEGDGERNRIFAEAFGRDPEFFAFYRSMQAYEAGLKSGDTRMLLKPDSEFFRFFVDPSGKGRDGGASAPGPGTTTPGATHAPGTPPADAGPK
jgi:membrane protease subunit HflC